MRKQVLGLIVPLLAVVLIAAAADTTGRGGAASAQLQRLEVAHGQDGLRVEFRAKGTLVPKMTTLDSPARIVVDFPNTVMATAQSSIVVDKDGVKDVRIGMDREGNTRVVVDLMDSRQHELVAGADGGFTLKIQGRLAHGATSAEVKPVATSAAPKLMMASAPAASTPAASIPTTSVAASAPSVRGKRRKRPRLVPLGEPNLPTRPTNDRAGKAEEAGSRFADKTAAELVA